VVPDDGHAEVVRHVVVRGRVHGVGFRASCAARATAASVSGWVANRADGTVEALFAGPAGAVDQLVEWCRHGPPLARVTSVDVTDASPSATALTGTGFAIR
jgi:acylphosphatase